jgi:hypothetical protein
VVELVAVDAKSEFEFFVGSGGGARWNRALSCASVSRIKAVMSCAESNAFVKILGPWKGSSAIEFEHREICSRWEESKEAMLNNMRCSIISKFKDPQLL